MNKKYGGKMINDNRYPSIYRIPEKKVDLPNIGDLVMYFFKDKIEDNKIRGKTNDGVGYDGYVWEYEDTEYGKAINISGAVVLLDKIEMYYYNTKE